MTTTTTRTPEIRNGVDVAALHGLIADIKADPARGMTNFHVTTRWAGGARSETEVAGWTIGGEEKPKNFTIAIDEPPELLGKNTAPNPQETLLAAMNACIMATYVALFAAHGVNLESLEIETEGDIDLRGFLAIDKAIKPGYDELRYTVRVKCDGDPETINAVHQAVIATSPNYWNMANAIPLRPTLVVE